MAVTIAILASIIGFGISFYIYRKQHGNKPLMCPRRAPCETVLNSPQATTFGISNAGLGLAFYAVIFFITFSLYLGGSSPVLEIPLIILTAGGFAFSLYLVQVQRKVIKQWCVWCLGSAAMATILFIASIFIVF